MQFSFNFKEMLKQEAMTYYSCLASVTVLSFYVHWLPPFMILWVVFWFLENKSGLDINDILRKKTTFLFILFLALFIWQIIGMIYADSLGTGIERIIKRASFLLFPLVLFYPGAKIIKKAGFVLRLFSICTFIYLIYCFGNAINNSFSIVDGKWIFNSYHDFYVWENYFVGYRLSAIVHPTYLSMYVLFSLIISLNSSFDKGYSPRIRFLWLILSVTFLIVIYLLSSRAGILAAVIVLSLYFLSKLYSSATKWKTISLMFFIMLISAVLIMNNSRLKYSYEEISGDNLTDTFNKDTRFLIWKSAFEVIKNNPVLGVGTGDASSELKKEFTSRGHTEGFYDNLNAHNQYLEILLENGIIGLLFFLAILGYMSYIAISDKNFLLLLFIVMVVVFFLFETILNRLAGVTFFPLFTYLTIHYKRELQ